jgi:hypothetical protein
MRTHCTIQQVVLWPLGCFVNLLADSLALSVFDQALRYLRKLAPLHQTIHATVEHYCCCFWCLYPHSPTSTSGLLALPRSYRRSFTPKVQVLLHQAVRDGLRRCGGYLCRVQEGDLRFMVAFASPAAALEWCLVVQEAAMFLPWPAEPVLLYEGCTVERDGNGRIVFRGPRIKMGVCECTDGWQVFCCRLCVH